MPAIGSALRPLQRSPERSSPLDFRRSGRIAALRLLPMSGRDKDAEILALRHQLAVLAGATQKPVGLSGRGARRQSPRSGGWCCPWSGRTPVGTRRVHGELVMLGVKVAASTVWRSSRTRASTRHPSAVPPPGPHSCGARPNHTLSHRKEPPRPSVRTAKELMSHERARWKLLFGRDTRQALPPHTRRELADSLNEF